MKIFNWMHRRLHPSMSYSQVSQKKEVVFGGETEKEEMVRQREGHRDTEALLLHDMLDGILTIGTLGHGHPCHVLFSQSNSPQEESLQKEQEKEEGEDEDQEQQVVLAVAAFVVEERKPMAVLESALVKSPLDEEDKKMVQMVMNEEEPEKLLEEPLLKNKEKKERGRTTLAELFAADASMDRRNNAFKRSQVANPVAIRPPSACPKTNTPHKKKGANPAQANTTSTKLHRLWTRMLKKKIHPELNEQCTTGEVPLMTAQVGISSRTEVV
ncbi:protein TILLER ANGLE CONTROL 1 [Elaeis guineensis]|uniref:Protein TILLER ANGLE CONTROL 1 n=1 Tax=Elaeis guineensis var. tenera TaxID=51953 RepID=A0A6I9QI29_ELAGV|nr:uncharacterized protein LOC105035873 isoform X2 [Elaeis guineensis]